MSHTFEHNGIVYRYNDYEELCRSWRSSSGANYNTKEVTELMLACLDNLKEDSPGASNFSDYREIFTEEEINFLKWLKDRINPPA